MALHSAHTRRMGKCYGAPVAKTKGKSQKGKAAQAKRREAKRRRRREAARSREATPSSRRPTAVAPAAAAATAHRRRQRDELLAPARHRPPHALRRAVRREQDRRPLAAAAAARRVGRARDRSIPARRRAGACSIVRVGAGAVPRDAVDRAHRRQQGAARRDRDPRRPPADRAVDGRALPRPEEAEVGRPAAAHRRDDRLARAARCARRTRPASIAVPPATPASSRSRCR